MFIMILKFANSQVLTPLNPGQATPAPEQSLVDQAPLAPLEVPKQSSQTGGQGKKAEDLKGMGKDQDKKKTSSDPKEKAQDAVASQPGQTGDSLTSKTKAKDMRTFLLFLFVFFRCCFSCCCFFFFF